jgi:hypothetical protein
LTLAQRIVALHEALARAGIPHAFGGAIALAYWTLDPRGTSDIDLNVFVAAPECGLALRALPEGVDVPARVEAAIAEHGQARVFWEDTPLDLFFDYAPVHEDAARHRVIVPFSGVDLPVLGPVELAVFKAMFDRTRDWADLEAMAAADTLDVDAVKRLLAPMVAPDDARFDRLAETVRRAATDPGTLKG